MITVYDTSAVNNRPEMVNGDNPKCALTQCTHLFSESAQEGDKVSFLLFLAQLRFCLCWHDAQDWP